MIPLVWLSFAEGKARCCWDCDIIDVIAPSTLYEHHHSPVTTVTGAVVVIPARYNVDHVKEINRFLKPLSWAVVILTSDEESLFPWWHLHHPNLRIWIQSPRPKLHPLHLRFLPVGCPSSTAWATMTAEGPQPLSVFFSGQVNHRQRDEMLSAFRDYPSSFLQATGGFTQGLPRADYLSSLVSAKIAPCPSGPASADSFRVWEALEAGVIPIVDDGPLPDPQGRAHTSYPRGFWKFFDPPFPIVDNWAQAPYLADGLLADWPTSANHIFAWWQLKKRSLRQLLLTDIADLGGTIPTPDLTVVVPTSPTPNNPDYSHLSATITAIRSYTDAEILLMIDGLHPQQSDLKPSYDEYVRRVLWMTNHHWTNTTPILFNEYLHQSGKLLRTLPYVTTPLILWNEHDTPLEGPIEWQACINMLLADELDLIRFYHEADIHPEHEWLMRGRHNDWLMKTVQQSGRPHLARTDYYRRVMKDHFSSETHTFIEYVMHSVCQQEDIQPWDRHRMALYAPQDGKPIKRSGHIDARGGAPLYEDTLVK